ncbi:hypothetical protein DQ04_03901050 [Trypanosoma grayi]|uniref:hypothetical protein n=1 Tax=Trypanosoma grayi TaxID=71804 RepID=UPI0004F463E7|nr:hypothetical protein DQ04_03901050 [Trypanosoma grayi]KEG10310.1 hypothetical protein DQ04_03901050 [Trypanosoma grayi]
MARCLSPRFLLLFVAILAAAAAVGGSAALMDLNRLVTTVAGSNTFTGTVDGLPGVSRLRRPFALCRGETADEILVGDGELFRTYSRRTMRLGTLFGGGGSAATDGPFEQAKLFGPQGCVRMDFGDFSVVYFVEGQRTLRYFTNRTVRSLELQGGGSFTDVTIYNNMLYLTDSNNGGVWSCSIESDGVPSGCFKRVGFSCGVNQYHAITVTEQGVFVVGKGSSTVFAGICWFNMNGAIQGTLPGRYVDVFSLSGGRLYAAMPRELYHVSTAGTNLTAERFVGNSTQQCPPAADGFSPNICEAERLMVIAENEMYITVAQGAAVRSVTLPAAVVADQLPRQPLPVGFPDEDNIIPDTLSLMNAALNQALGTSDTVVDVNSLQVDDDSWATDFEVLVQQLSFDNETTPGLVRSTDHQAAQMLVRQYYDRTDEVVYMDTNVVPYCSSRKMLDLERGIVALVRDLLKFPLIYSDEPQAVTINGVPNITTMKLLMSERFANDTTSAKLEEANLTGASLRLIRGMYDDNHTARLVFPDPPYDFSQITPEQMQNVRWFILSRVQARLEECAQLIPGGDSDGCNATITNRTEKQILQPPFNTQSEYEVFVPDFYNFNATRCVEDMDWDDLFYLLGNYSEINNPPPEPRCNRGCIIGVAIAAAIVLTAIIAVIVVLTSKRKRLAAVVAPAHPKFKGTLDEEDEELGSSNPLDSYGNGSGRDRM